MRVRRALAAGLLALAGGTAVTVLAATPASAAGVVGYLTLDPRSGPANTLISAEFQAVPVDHGCPQINVVFTWDGHPVAGSRLSHCVALASFKPPSSYRKSGPHQVLATDDTGKAFGSAIFMITTGPSASPTPGPSTGSPTPGRSRSARATQSATDATSDAPLSIYSGPSVDSSVAAADAGTGGPPGQGSSGGGSSAMTVALTFGGALVLGGVLILGFIVYRGRRGDPEYVLEESPTQPIPRFPAPRFPGTFVPPPDEGGAEPWRPEPPVPE